MMAKATKPRKIIRQATVCRDLAKTFGIPEKHRSRLALIVFLSKSFPERLATKRGGVWYDKAEYLEWKREMAEVLQS